MFAIVFCWLFVLARAHENNSRIVTIASGKVRGYKDKEYDIFVFNGIPYATAPRGPNKFKAPLSAPVWDKIFEATNAHVMCPQNQMFKGSEFSKHNIREDCLVANIYVPNTNEKKLPVLVDIHGGGYQMGYGNMLTLNKLVNTKRVIVVNFNYRLGVYGFLCLGTRDVPGNAGMKDIVALLRWVKNNIAAFGGNPSEVTVSEYSAGPSAVQLLLLSPTAKDLFKRAIPENGPNLSIYSIQADPIEVAKKYAKKFNFHNANIYALENFYKTLSIQGLSKENLDVEENMQFVPCIERDLGEEPFLLYSPYDLSNMGSAANIPILYGFTNMKWMKKKEQFEYWNSKINEDFFQFLPIDLKFQNEIEKESVSATAKEFYFGKELLNYNKNSVKCL
ncbi:putative inactive carboxylesterase 4 [Plodia interpunctella]|uniref:putative inactive carboxylesterase 4 n=1 Tax=Plodia interpunctella TaxID=58824 RepID=UPI0031016D02